MERCVKDVKAQGKTEQQAIAICYDAIKGKQKVEKAKHHYSEEQAKEVGDKMKLDWKKYSLKEFTMGMNDEQEHDDVTYGDPIMVGKIVLAHLKEDKNYYSDLKAKMPGEAGGKTTMIDDIEKAVWTTAYVNDLPDSSFAYISPGGKKDSDGKTTPRSLRHLPYKDSSGKVDAAHVRNALARLSQTQIPADAKAKAKVKLTSAAHSVGVDVSDDKKSEDVEDLTKGGENKTMKEEIKKDGAPVEPKVEEVPAETPKEEIPVETPKEEVPAETPKEEVKEPTEDEVIKTLTEEELAKVDKKAYMKCVAAQMKAGKNVKEAASYCKKEVKEDPKEEGGETPKEEDQEDKKSKKADEFVTAMKAVADKIDLVLEALHKADDVPADGATPKEDAPKVETPAVEVPKEEKPAEETPKEEVPVVEPVKPEVPVEEPAKPVVETPAKPEGASPEGTEEVAKLTKVIGDQNESLKKVSSDIAEMMKSYTALKADVDALKAQPLPSKVMSPMVVEKGGAFTPDTKTEALEKLNARLAELDKIRLTDMDRYQRERMADEAFGLIAAKKALAIA